MEVVQGGVSAPRVWQVFEAGSEPIQRRLPGAFDTQGRRIDWTRAGQAPLSQSTESEVRFACRCSSRGLQKAWNVKMIALSEVRSSRLSRFGGRLSGRPSAFLCSRLTP